MFFSRTLSSKSRIALIAVSALASFTAVTQANAGVSEKPQVLFTGPYATITTDDVLADAKSIPPELREKALSSPDQVGQVAETLFVRRTLAAQAKEQKLTESAIAKASLQLAIDREQANLLLDKLYTESVLSDADKEKYAQNIYKAEPEKFQAPADSRAKHILILGDTPESKIKIDEIFKDLKKGSNFDNLAKEKSEDPGSSKRDGDLGYFPKGKMVTEFDAEIEKLKIGEISEPFKTKFGWHIVKLEDRRPARTLQFSEVKDNLFQQANEIAFRKNRNSLIESIKNEAKPDFDAIKNFSEKQK